MIVHPSEQNCIVMPTFQIVGIQHLSIYHRESRLYIPLSDIWPLGIGLDRRATNCLLPDCLVPLRPLPPLSVVDLPPQTRPDIETESPNDPPSPRASLPQPRILPYRPPRGLSKLRLFRVLQRGLLGEISRAVLLRPLRPFVVPVSLQPFAPQIHLPKSFPHPRSALGRRAD